ncbi:carboxypeptidase [Dactylonectria macrodidyma]|uniref:Carboxypeptidase n=1 Tax=Dactylonectria macrodidyma TaxID=307937 RepID=A0A9P9J2S3_9HYPO|nr:carboxypeptidase [Dactylonectria macrodidyma]
MRVAAFILGFCTAAQAYQYGYNHPPFLKDDETAAAYFPDIDVELLSPAFLKPESRPADFSNSTQGPTSLEVLNSYIKSLAEKNSWVTYKRFNGVKKVRVWIQGAIHGDEPGADQAVLAVLGKLNANQKWARSLLRRLDIFILPRYSADGVFYFQYVLASNYDPNRDHIKLAREQTRNVKAAFSKFAPHVAVDAHEFAGTRQYGRWHHGADYLLAAAKNLNIHPDIRHMAESLFTANAAEALEAKGVRWESYVTSKANTDVNSNTTFTEASSDAKIGHNAMGPTQCISFLSETRGR